MKVDPNVKRRERDARNRARKREYGVIICEVWERSGIGVKGGCAWSVTNAAITEAVICTYCDNISREDWILNATSVFKEGITYETR